MARSATVRSSALAALCALLLWTLSLPLASPASADIRYLYDELGRLVRVIREDGAAASYHYDAVGNLLQITRESGVAQTTTVDSQSATSGSRETSVTLTLTGSNLIGAGIVSSVPGITLQSVETTFDGITLTLLIAADAPLGAALLEVRGGLGTVTVPFTVLTAPPGIASFSPPFAGAGAVVTLQGAAFDPAPANNQVAFNGTPAAVQAATETLLTVLVPPGATSGPITVTTATGTATSPTSFVTGLVGVTNVTPAQGVRGQTVSVTITGSNLVGASASGFDFSPSNVVATDTQLTMDLTIGLAARSSTFTVTNQVTSVPAPFTAVPGPPAIAGLAPPLGPAGRAVTIDGEGFDDVTPTSNVVRFNGVAAEVVAATPVALTAVVPAGATSGPATVTTGQGTATSPATFSIIESTVPVLATIERPFADPGDVRLAPDRSRAYVTNRGRNAVSVVDTATHAITATIPTAVEPFQSAVSTDGTRLYVVAASGALSVLNLTTNTPAATLDVGEPLTVGVSRDGQTVLVPRLNSTVALVNAASATIVGSLPVGPTPGRVVVSPVGDWAHVINFGDSSVSVIDTAARALVTTIAMPLGGDQGVFSPDGTRYYQSDPENVSVVDTATNAIVATIPGVGGANALAIDPAGTRLYVATGFNPARAGPALVAIDTASNTIAGTLAVPRTPRDLAVTTDGQRVIALSFEDRLQATIVDAGAFTVSATVFLSGEDVVNSVALDTARLYVLASGSDNISVLDAAAGAPVDAAISRTAVPGGISFGRRLVVPAGGQRGYGRAGGFLGFLATIDSVGLQAAPNIMMPQDSDGDRAGIIAVAADAQRAYTDVEPVFAVFDAGSGQATATLPIPAVNEIVARLDGSRVYVITNAGDVRVIDPAAGTELASVNVGAALGRAALNAAGTRLYIRSITASAVFVVDTAGPSLVTTIPVGSVPFEPVLTGDGQEVVVVNQGSNTVSLIDTATNTVAATLSPGGALSDLATSPTAPRAYVTDVSGNRVIVIDTSANTMIGDVPLQASPTGIAVSADGARLFVSQGSIGLVSVVDTQTDAVAELLAVDGSPGKPVVGPGGRVFIPSGGAVVVIE